LAEERMKVSSLLVRRYNGLSIKTQTKVLDVAVSNTCPVAAI